MSGIINIKLNWKSEHLCAIDMIDRCATFPRFLWPVCNSIGVPVTRKTDIALSRVLCGRAIDRRYFLDSDSSSPRLRGRVKVNSRTWP